MIGTTQFTNAVVERQHLSEVAAIRIGLPSGEGLPPMIGWPGDIASSLGDARYMIRGGTLYDGRPLSALEPAEIDTVIADIKRRGLSTVAISAPFSPMTPEPELQVARQLREAIPNATITCSHEVGRLGLLERENAGLDIIMHRDSVPGIRIWCGPTIERDDLRSRNHRPSPRCGKFFD